MRIQSTHPSTSTSRLLPAGLLSTRLAQPAPLHRVSPDRPFQAGWKAYGGHRMYVGAFESAKGDWILLATDKAHEAAGFETAQECESAMRAAGFIRGGSDHLQIEPFKGQMALF